MRIVALCLGAFLAFSSLAAARAAEDAPPAETGPATALPSQPIGPDDGWCDAPGDAAYNQPVKLPYPASAEALWLEDHVYDLIVVLGHNDDPPVSGMGSAIFLHLARPDYAPTAGCVALARPDLEAVLLRAAPGDLLKIQPARGL